MNNVLVIKIGAIGDVVLSLPILSTFKDSSITWVVGKETAPLLEATGKVNSIIIVDEYKLLHGSIFAKLAEVLKVWKKIFFQRFNLVITAHRDPRYRLLSLVCFKKQHRFFQKNQNGFPLRGVFHSLEYLQLATDNPLNQVKWPSLILPQVVYPKKHPLIVFFPGGDRLDPGKKLRIWPISHYVKCVELLQSYQCQCALIGLGSDKELISFFNKDFILNYIGSTTVLQVLSLLKQCFCLITHDSGALHLGRLVGCRVCGIFGPTSPQDFAWPSENEIAVCGKDPLECRPCYNGKGFAKCTHQSCMKQVSAETVVETIIKKWGLKLRENSTRS